MSCWVVGGVVLAVFYLVGFFYVGFQAVRGAQQAPGMENYSGWIKWSAIVVVWLFLAVFWPVLVYEAFRDALHEQAKRQGLE